MFDIYDYDDINEKFLEMYKQMESTETMFVVFASYITMLYLIAYFIQN